MASFQSKFFKTATKIIINGKQYGSLDEVPPEFRKLFEDKDADGRPDWIQEKMAGSFASASSMEMTTVNGVTTYKVGDREYRSLDEMPAEHRALFEDRDGDGLPDMIPKLPGLPGAAVVSEGSPVIDVVDSRPDDQWPDGRDVTQPRDVRSTVRDDLEFAGESKGGGLFAAILLLLLVVVVGAIIFLLSRAF